MNQIVTFKHGNDKITVEKIPIDFHPEDNIYQSVSKLISFVIDENIQDSETEIIIIQTKNKKFIITTLNYNTAICEVCFELLENTPSMSSIELYKVKFDIDFSNLFNNYKIV